MTRYHGYYINQAEYGRLRRVPRGGYSVNISHPPDIFVEPIEHYDAESFRALIGKISDKNYHTPSSITSYTYFTDYKCGDNGGALTFDGVTFFKILGFYNTSDNKVEINLRCIRKIHYKPDTVFMLMPFRAPALNDFYVERIKKSLGSEMRIDVLRADDICDSDVIIDTIYLQIESSEFIIAEISELNKNVFYELGYAAAKEKDIIMMLQSGKESAFFDRSHIRWIEYSIEEPEPFKKQLMETIKSIRNKRVGSI